MIQDFKLAFKLIRYGLSYKLEVSMGLLFGVIGIVVDFFSKGETYVGGFYIVLSVFMIFQLIISLDVSTLVQSSGYKRKVQLVFPYLVVVPLMLIAFTIVVFLHVSFIYTGVSGQSAADNFIMQTQYLLQLSALLFLTQCYFGFCYKHIVLATILLVIAVIPFSFVSSTLSFMTGVCNSLPLTIVISYILVLGGAGVSYLISALFYRQKLSQMVFQQSIKRAMR